jgi:hypothetical protein
MPHVGQVMIALPLPESNSMFSPQCSHGHFAIIIQNPFAVGLV